MGAVRVPEAVVVVLDDGGDDFAFEDAASRLLLPERQRRRWILTYGARPFIRCRCLFWGIKNYVISVVLK